MTRFLRWLGPTDPILGAVCAAITSVLLSYALRLVVDDLPLWGDALVVLASAVTGAYTASRIGPVLRRPIDAHHAARDHLDAPHVVIEGPSGLLLELPANAIVYRGRRHPLSRQRIWTIPLPRHVMGVIVAGEANLVFVKMPRRTTVTVEPFDFDPPRTPERSDAP